jgi:hypothetical protein
MLTEGGVTPETRVHWAFRHVTGREPDAAELKVLVSGVQKRLKRASLQPDPVQKLIAFGASKANPALNPAEISIYALTANVLLNLDEVVARN